MADDEATDLIKRGFQQLNLTIELAESDDIFSEISWCTDRIAQHIHELCLIIAQNAVRNGAVIDRDVVNKSTSTWIDDSLSSDLAVIESAMNARDTKAGRKNQILYAMGQCKTEDFKYSDIENLVRNEFAVGSATLNVSAILSGFGGSDNPIIRRTPKQDAWRFASPKLKMAIRAKLQKATDGKVSLRT